MSHELGYLTWLGNWSLEVSWENDATFCQFILCLVESKLSDFTGDLVVKNPPANEGDMGLIPKIPHVESVSQEYLQTKPMRHNYWSPCALKCQSPAPAGPGLPKEWVALGKKKKTDTNKVAWKKKLLFIFRTAQFL